MRHLEFVDRQQAALVKAVLTAVADGAGDVLLYPVCADANDLAKVLRAELSADVKVRVSSSQPPKRGRPNGRSLGAGVVVLLPDREETLPSLLLGFLDWEGGWLIAPQTARSSKNVPLFVVSVPKAGTHMLFELARQLGYRDGVELTSFARPAHWYCLEYSNSHTTAEDFFVDSVRRAPFGNRAHPFPNTPTLFLYRNPLDILVSEANYYHKDGNTVFSGYFPQESFDARVDRLINDSWMLGSIRERVGRFLPWTDFPNVIPVSYEELVGTRGGGDDAARARLIWSLQLKLQAPGVPERIAEGLFDRDSPTFHKGMIGGYRSSLSVAAMDRIAAFDQDFIEQFGYTGSDRNSFPFPPLRADEFRRRPLAFSAVDHDLTPITLDACLGCNLVRYMQRYYAIPQHLGVIDLRTLSETERAGFESADTVGELRNRLLLGSRDYDQVLLRAAQHKTPQVLQESYLGYNLISFAGRIWAAERKAGPVDFSDPEALASWLADGRLISAGSIDGAKMAVDRLLDRIKAATGLSGLAASFESRVDEVAADLKARQDDVAARLEVELQQGVTRNAEATNLLGARLQNDQQALAGRLSRIAPESVGPPRILEEDYRGFNLIAAVGGVWGVKCSAGPIDFFDDLARQAWLADGRLIRADTLDGVRISVDQAALAGRIDEVASRTEELSRDLTERIDEAASRADGLGQGLVGRIDDVANAAAGLRQGLIKLRDEVAEEFRFSKRRSWYDPSGPSEGTGKELPTPARANEDAVQMADASMDFVEHAPVAYVAAIQLRQAALARSGATVKEVLIVGSDQSLLDEIAFRLKDSIAASIVTSGEFTFASCAEHRLIALAENDSEILSSLLQHFSDHPRTLIAPVTSRHVSQQGAYIVTIPKSGSHLLYELLDVMGVHHDTNGYLQDLEPPLGGTWKSAKFPHTHLWAPQFLSTLSAEFEGGGAHPFFSRPVVFLYRNPCDILISESYYYADPSKTPLAAYFGTMSREQRLCSLIDWDPLIGSLGHRMGGYLPWFQFGNVIPVSYEELVGETGGGSNTEQLQLIWSLQLKLQVPGSAADIAAKLRNRGTNTATYRRGTLGGHKSELTEFHWKLLAKEQAEYMPQMGYLASRDSSDPFPARRAFFRRRPVDLACQTGQQEVGRRAADAAANIVQEDYCGYNLIASLGGFWAIALDVGEVDFGNRARLEDLKASGLAMVSDTVDGLRVAVLSRHVAKTHAALEKRLSLVVPNPDVEPQLLEEDYFGYNLLVGAGKLWALEVAAGEVDFADAGAIEALLGDRRMLVADSLDRLRVAILSLELARKEARLDLQLRDSNAALAAAIRREGESLAQELRQSDAVLAGRLAAIAPERGSDCEILEGDYRGFNLVAYEGGVWALEMAAGEIDLAATETIDAWRADGRLFFSATLDGARAQVDRLHDRRAHERTLAGMDVAVGQRLAELESRLGAQMDAADHRANAVQREFGERLAELERPWWWRLLTRIRKHPARR